MSSRRRAGAAEVPLLIRFQDILRHRVESINQAFRKAIAEFEYPGVYRGVFPVKVNQLARSGRGNPRRRSTLRFGLEVGSKPELLAGLALQDQEGSDHLQRVQGPRFIRMALLGRKLGRNVIMVVEKLEELRQIIAVSRQFGVEPQHRHSVSPCCAKGAGVGPTAPAKTPSSA
jgi:arginine decarboxylase